MEQKEAEFSSQMTPYKLIGLVYKDRVATHLLKNAGILQVSDRSLYKHKILNYICDIYGLIHHPCLNHDQRLNDGFDKGIMVKGWSVRFPGDHYIFIGPCTTCYACLELYGEVEQDCIPFQYRLHNLTDRWYERPSPW
ncbi:hypothetical protein AVEN_178118-1 [Araneus ventricosus]|uniref:Uncharacterized protein n=1 Tax=Araneus ventricosus TaxID=182803 RepID=A0A4Y2M917_ARAVE|nr:hypothetical protein AVEN_178118-1 [Araneus ventricosus]